MKELSYAVALARPVIPVHVQGEVGIRGNVPQIAERQWVDVRPMDAEAEQKLLRAVTKSGPAPQLPHPLPVPPTVPISYTLQVRQVLERQQLDRQSQEWVLDEVERRHRQGEEPLDLIELLDELGRHNDFFNALDARRQHLRGLLVALRPAARQAAAPPPPTHPATPPTPAQQQLAGAAPGEPRRNSRSSGTSIVVTIALAILLLFVIGACAAILSGIEQPCDPNFELCF